MARPSKDKYYLNIAKAVGKRSPCLRRKFGAIILKEDAIISTGYNGPPRGGSNCEYCLKDEVGADHWKRYDLCPAVHAEENSLINAARNGAHVTGGKLYIVGKDMNKGDYTESHPCDRCRRALINAGITEVITEDREEKVIRYDVSEWAKEDRKDYLEAVKKAQENKSQ